jgi:release factor glutamine methyltransferase
MAPESTGPAIPEVLRRSIAYLERHGVESARANVETLLMHLLGVSRTELYARRDGLDTATARALGRALCQRCTGVPLQHLTGGQEFFGLELMVEPGVFVPRPETETLVEAALEALDAGGVENPLVVDVGTGTGAVALAIAHERPRAGVHATDLNPRAAALARRNADALGLASRVSIHEGDLLDPMPTDLGGRLYLIVSNPPYLEPSVAADLRPEVLADPAEALFGGTQVHERLARAAPGWLAPGGWLIVEIDPSQASDVRRLFDANGLESVGVRTDLAGRDRVVAGRMPGRNPGRTIART